MGYMMLAGTDFPWEIAEIIHQHHERMDGSGYPCGLYGDEILLEARIIAVADVMEAMSSYRPYRPALGIEAALSEISEKSGSLYDPTVVDACMKLIAEGRFAF
jgi:HD-GYP domain-containing protein (c-di-GMP phosphodiesterase class II)